VVGGIFFFATSRRANPRRQATLADDNLRLSCWTMVGNDVPVHAADVQASEILLLKAGAAVDFDLGSNRRNGK